MMDGAYRGAELRRDSGLAVNSLRNGLCAVPRSSRLQRRTLMSVGRSSAKAAAGLFDY